MARLPGTTSSPVVKREVLPRVDTAVTVVLAGREAIALREGLHQQFAGGGKVVEWVAADSILEAVLMSGGMGEGGEDRAGEVRLVVAGVSQELDQIEAAVRSLRKVYPEARIILGCEPGDEVVCRKAKGWGATDYFILPADAGSLERLCVLTPLPVAVVSEPVRAVGVPGGGVGPADLIRQVVEVQANAQEGGKLPIRAAVLKARENGGNAGQAAGVEGQLPGLPLMVQTVLMSDLLNGRADFAERVVATLQTYVKWNGKLRFVAAGSAAGEGAGQIQQAVALAGQPALGTLVLEPEEHLAWPAAGVEATLAQAAQWMATVLSISRRYEQLRTLASTDELSGAYNRRYFNRYMAQLLEKARVNRFRVTLLLFDIDDFKKYNDTFGHASGDAIIRELIKLLRLCTRPDDLVARLGGDEFAVVYWDHEAPRQPNSEHPKDVLSATERFRKAIKNHPWPEICKIQGEVSISGGLATFPWDADTLESLMARADQALLRAKAAGKNVILLHGADGFPCEDEGKKQG